MLLIKNSKVCFCFDNSLDFFLYGIQTNDLTEHYTPTTISIIKFITVSITIDNIQKLKRYLTSLFR